MSPYQECYNFFKDCKAFVILHQRFLTACKTIRDQNEKLDTQMLNLIVDLFADIRKEMNSTCQEHKCIVNYHLYSDDESESDISDIAESDNHESDDEDMDDTDTPDESDDDDESDNEDDEDDSDNEDDGVDEVDFDYNMADFFQNDNCCIHEILEPFLEALKVTNQFDVVKKIRKLDDENEQSCLRFDKWFSPHEKDECVMMMKEILFNFYSEGTKYFKLCESKYIKLLATYCKDNISEKTGNEMLDKYYAKIVDVEFPLNKKRKLFTNSDTITKILDHIRDETMPILKKYLEERQRNILMQMST